MDTGKSSGELSTISADLDDLLKGARNFNFNINVLKRLLDLKDRESGYEDMKSNLDRSSVKKSVSDDKNCESVDLSLIRKKMEFLKQEVEASQLLGFCLAFNIQRLQKKLTGIQFDAGATESVIETLWDKYNQSKTNEAMLKYEFEEKRKLLRKLRQQLEQTRRDWQNFKMRRPDPESPEDRVHWDGLRQEAIRSMGGFTEETPSASRASSETDSAVQSDGDGDDPNSNPLEVFDRRRNRLDQLEEDCFQLVNDLVTKHGAEMGESLEFSSEYNSPLMPPEVDDVDDDGLSSDEFEDDDDDENEDDDEEEILLPLAPEPEAEIQADPEASVADLTQLSWDTAEAAAGSATLLTPEIQVSQIESARDADNRSRSTSFSSRGEGRMREDSFAETGEPIVLCRLRRRAVEILISRLREEKNFHETRENEMRVKLAQVQDLNNRLQEELRKYVADHHFVNRMALVGFAVLFVATVRMFC